MREINFRTLSIRAAVRIALWGVLILAGCATSPVGEIGGPGPTLIPSANSVISYAVAGQFASYAWENGKVVTVNLNTGRLVSIIPPIASFHLTSIALSRQPSPTIVLLGSTIEHNGLLIAYDMHSGHTLYQMDTNKRQVSQVLCFSRDGTKIYWFTSEGRLVAAASETGNQIWTTGLKYPRIVKVSDDGNHLIMYDDHTSVQLDDASHDDSEAKVLWDVEFSDLRLPIQSPNSGPVIIFHSSTSTLSSLSPDSGKTLWKIPFASVDDLRSISADGSALVFVQEKKVKVLFPFQQSRQITLASLNAGDDFQVTDDGKYILSLPSIKPISFDRATNIMHVARPSNVLKVVDSATGKIDREIDLDAMQSK